MHLQKIQNQHPEVIMLTQTKSQNYIENTPEYLGSLTYPVSITQRQFWLINQLSPDIAVPEDL